MTAADRPSVTDNARTRDGMDPTTRAVSDTLDEYLHRHHGILTSHTNAEDFITWLGEQGYEVRAAARAETTTEATERIARQIAATTAMTGTDAREYVEAVQALQHAETTTATVEDAARALYEEHAWSGCAGSAWENVPDGARAGWEYAAGLLARPLPDRDQIAEVLADTEPDVAPGYYEAQADAVLGLLRGGGDDR